MRFLTVKATAALESGSTPETVPSEFTLLKAGVNAYYGDETMLFDAAAAASVMALYSKRGLDLMADYEHQSLTVPPIIAPASAKKWTPELRNGDLVASNIAWTPKAKQMIADGEYRYFSIACRIDAKTRRVVEVINFALTNNPAADQISPLMAASITSQKSETDMKTVIVALGLSADTEETAAVSKASRLVELERDVLALTNAKTPGEAIGVLHALKASHEQVAALSARVKDMEAAQVKVDCEALIKAAVDDGRLPPAKRAETEAFSVKYGLEALKSSLAMLTRVAASAHEKPIEVPAGETATEVLTPAEIKIAKAFCGGDAEVLAKRLDGLRAIKKAERAEQAAI